MEAIAKVKRAAFWGSIPLGRPRLDDDDLAELRRSLLAHALELPPHRQTRDSVAGAMGMLRDSGPTGTFKRIVRSFGPDDSGTWADVREKIRRLGGRKGRPDF